MDGFEFQIVTFPRETQAFCATLRRFGRGRLPLSKRGPATEECEVLEVKIRARDAKPRNYWVLQK